MAWRNLSDEKPIDGQDCLVWCKQLLHVQRATWVTAIDDFSSRDFRGYRITHWMPTPEPPKPVASARCDR